MIRGIIVAMNKILLITVAFWVLLFGPGLCIAGVIDHICDDCVEETACGHEDDCDSDPCIEILQITNTTTSVDVPVTVCTLATDNSNNQYTSLTAILPTRENLPQPESDIPLLN